MTCDLHYFCSRCRDFLGTSNGAARSSALHHKGLDIICIFESHFLATGSRATSVVQWYKQGLTAGNNFDSNDVGSANKSDSGAKDLYFYVGEAPPKKTFATCWNDSDTVLTVNNSILGCDVAALYLQAGLIIGHWRTLVLEYLNA